MSPKAEVSNDNIVVAQSVDMLDYELELGIVIGKKGRYIPVEEAGDYIDGYFVANDLGDRSVTPEVPGGRSLDDVNEFSRNKRVIKSRIH